MAKKGLFRLMTWKQNWGYKLEGEKLNNFVKICCSLLDTRLSGSPIMQENKLVGAVTHVLVNNPTKGYGIFIEEMMGEKSQ